MAKQIATGGAHHISLTVTDMGRSRDFYTTLLSFKPVMDLPGGGVLLNNGQLTLALHTAPDPGQAPPADRFNENRVGLDHLSFSVSSRAEMEEAARMFDECAVSHGEIDAMTWDGGRG